ncbi:MAG: phosphoenolpyruvate--protein phosphotransferase [Parachlamydiales bacterium]
MSKEKREIRLRGAPISSGIAIGSPYLYKLATSELPTFTVAREELQGEVDRYHRALEESKREVKVLLKRMGDEGAIEGAAILESHLQMMQDPMLTEGVLERIRKTRINTEAAFQGAINDFEVRFSKISDPFFRDRVYDLHDIARRVLGRLRQKPTTTLAELPVGSIVFANELVPSEAAEADAEKIAAFVTTTGGETSHAAIMAKSRGIPYVAKIDFSAAGDFTDAPVIVDGRIGEVILYPTEATLSKYRALQKELSTYLGAFDHHASYVAETTDGYQVTLSANVEMCSEVDQVTRYGGDGIGLFRSEYLCVGRQTFPSEEEQFGVYRQITEALPGKPCVIRTFDIGGDKFRQMEGVADEDNPFLGCRAIRLLLKETTAFRAQLSAILRASAFGDIRLLFPMVSGLPELLEAKGIVSEVKHQLRQQNVPFNEDIQIGCMIEVPSAALTTDILARECDFLSIGTNDLVQYSLAVDRDNEQMSYLYSPAHPSVIRLIKMITSEGNRNGVKVSLCGEVAADPRFTALLLGLGVQELSVAARYLPIIKNAIRSTSIIAAADLAERVLTMPTAITILDALIAEYQKTIGSSPSLS